MIVIHTEGMTSPTNNVRDLNSKAFRIICNELDLGSRWRELVECADRTRFQLSIYDVEECARVLQRNLNASPSEQLLLKWGMLGMTVQDLAQLLDHLRMEKLLVHIRQPEELEITKQPDSELTAEEGDMISLTCEASGFPYPIYVWFHGDKQLSIKHDGQLVIDHAKLSHSGKYICRIHHKYKNETPCLFTNSCIVDIKPRPASFCMPKHTTIDYYPDNRPEFGPPSINDYHSVAKSTKPFESIQSSDSIDHFPQFKEPPTILCSPTSRTDCIGGHNIFAVKATHPYEKLYYEWYHNSQPIEGAVTNELRFQIRGKEDAGDYQARVYTRSHGGVLSKVATLTVNQIPNVYTAADKVVLIIGISTYRSFGQPLPAVEHDLCSTIKLFTEMKFKVISLLDLTLTEMVNAVDEFCEMLSSEVYAVFYCAGHGFINNNQHYLIPWDARQGTDLRDSLCIEAVEAKIQKKKPKMLMMFLDICRRRVEHLNNLPIISNSIETSNPNKITIYAASVGEQSFEESQKCCTDPRGIFNQYLLEVLEKKNLNAFEVFEALQTKFKECQYNREKFPQHPEMTINLEESGRSLWDPIDPDKYQALAESRKYCCWAKILSLPPNVSAKMNGPDYIRLSFVKVASNVMDMIAVPCLTSDAKVRIMVPKEQMDPVLQPITASRIPSIPNATKFRFPNLQRLQSKLMLHLVIQLLGSSGNDVIDTRVCSVDLGQPLISNSNLGTAKHLSRVDRKEPMEHAECSVPFSDKQT